MTHIYLDPRAGKPIGRPLTIIDNTSSGRLSGDASIRNENLFSETGAAALTAEEKSDSASSPIATGINESRRSALVIEKDKSLSATLATLMRHEGYTVRSACDYEEGLRLYLHCKPFSVVLVDYSLPGDGLDLVKAILQQNRSQRVVIAAFHYRSEGEVPRPSELRHVPVLTDITQLRKTLTKFKFWASRDEIEEAIEKLTSAELLRLQQFADRMAQRLGAAARGRDGDDLLQEALLLTFEGARGGNGRHWKKGVDFCKYLEGAVKSKADNWKHKRALELQAHQACETITRDSEGWQVSPLDNATSNKKAADQRLIAREQIERILEGFEQDGTATKVLRGWSEGITGCEILTEYGMTSQQYEAAVKRIRVRMQKRGGERHGA